MSFKNQSVFSSTYTNTTFTVTEGMGISSITINLVSGSATLLGGLGIPGLTNSSVALTAGQPVVLNVNRGYTLEGVTVDSTAGGVFQIGTVYDYIDAPDPAATAFLSATGITGAVQSAAIDTLVKSLKAYNLWPYMKAVYPFVTDNVNLLGYTEDFSNAAWIKTGATVTANNILAPDGTMTADRVVFGAANNFIYQQTSFTATTANKSIYIKGTAGQTISLDDTWSLSPSNLITLTGDWQRVNFTSTTTSGQGQGLAISTYQSSTARTIWVWGAQLQLGSTATTYQPIATTQQAYITNQFKYNLVNPVDSDAAFRLVFNGGWTFSTNGALPNGTNGFANTYLNPFLAMSGYSQHLSMYSRTQNTSVNGANIGSYVAATNSEINLFQYYAGVSLKGGSVYEYPTYAATFNNTNTLGFQVVSRTSNNALKLHFNGSLLATNTNTETKTRPNLNMYLGASNWSTLGATQFTPHQNAFTSIGDGLTDAQSYNLARIVYAYETALSRQVGVPIVSDPDAQNFINAANITDLTQANAINNLVIGLKADGLWTKMKAIYPFVGGTASTNKYNLKDPRDLDAAFRLVFNGGWTHSNNGSTPNGTNGFANTFLNASTQITSNNNHVSIYLNQSGGRLERQIGFLQTSPLCRTYLYAAYGDGNSYSLIQTSSESLNFANTNRIGLFTLSRTASNSQSVYLNADLKENDNQVSTTLPSLNYFIGASNDNGTANLYSNALTQFSTIGSGLNATDVSNLSSRITTFNTSLSR